MRIFLKCGKGFKSDEKKIPTTSRHIYKTSSLFFFFPTGLFLHRQCLQNGIFLLVLWVCFVDFFSLKGNQWKKIIILVASNFQVRYEVKLEALTTFWRVYRNRSAAHFSCCTVAHLWQAVVSQTARRPNSLYFWYATVDHTLTLCLPLQSCQMEPRGFLCHRLDSSVNRQDMLGIKTKIPTPHFYVSPSSSIQCRNLLFWEPCWWAGFLLQP